MNTFSPNSKKEVMAAVKVDGWTLEYAIEKLKSDKEVVMAAVQQDGYSLKYASKNLQSDKDVVMSAVNQNGCSLFYVSENLQSDKEVIMTAVKQNWRALYYMDLCLKNDLMFLGELWEYGGEDVRKHISDYVTSEVESEIVKDPLYLANFAPSHVKPAK